MVIALDAGAIDCDTWAKPRIYGLPAVQIGCNFLAKLISREAVAVQGPLPGDLVRGFRMQLPKLRQARIHVGGRSGLKIRGVDFLADEFLINQSVESGFAIVQ